MRFRIYKRKVVILTVVVVICGLAFWTSGRQKKNEPFPKEAVPVVRKDTGASTSRSSLDDHIQVQATPAVSRAPVAALNQTHTERIKERENKVKPNVDNTTLVYRGIVFQLNFDQTIRNEEKFKGVRQDDLVVVVQVHNRPDYLKLLVDSLRKARGVETILLIFSHDYWSPEINKVVNSVDFCQVLQIFFPFSIQLYPQEFPGNDPRDCPRDIPKKEALKLGCINAEYPDSFGHYREAKFSQTKHHWWWKLHFTWDRVHVLQDHKGLVLLIEEDHFLSPDFIHLLRLMSALKHEQCRDCDILSLGSYSHVGYSSKANKVEVKAWKSTEHNMGMALSRDTYQKLLRCTDTFCTYDDYNWDWSLQHLTASCLPSYWKVMVSEAPRVFHAGDCGMHHKKVTCMPASQKTKIENILQSSSKQLFPKNLLITKRLPSNGAGGVAPHVKNGGWGDIRDHELCKSYVRLQ
ncbi:alpha-1,6-mannosyl-glycoprotein 2-beta-N-acetylglucosaminyltransferase [Phyllopteryx taeniolatus]|uniref:alpha-1,6-mannosyl-glycoprotein 2-beta-N-acetylglucosaminyltransferase n=1 Tax=Phyllopteryx taeniolatus TaxID=161469 RepID=UPI002AD2501A|nr:alpha-1,6-mannosyl-glycoprotein 2-beta-N-acetylglucosaminyltransferase [Phyllopteryx taeniolatus]XP_061609385.1 alpha-1,6-mannosyl-glycoprotein 2-beta-N-acetylglucosaminyltransferase [Phyllopteryx taeniolatus]XP_061609386.1 alpha-1,6-mannosyl-glycoprotein 2-beta-N-acetylglucosaminyltransferase [Phyllopteryx taeniolatus]